MASFVARAKVVAGSGSIRPKNVSGFGDSSWRSIPMRSIAARRRSTSMKMLGDRDAHPVRPDAERLASVLVGERRAVRTRRAEGVLQHDVGVEVDDAAHRRALVRQPASATASNRNARSVPYTGPRSSARYRRFSECRKPPLVESTRTIAA